MKLQVSKKAVKDFFTFVISASYTELQSLLQEQEAFSYCSGIYGHNCDNYKYNNVCISRGYRPIRAQNTRNDYDIKQKYEDLAKEVDHDFRAYEQKKAEKEKLIQSMIKELIIVEGR